MSSLNPFKRPVPPPPEPPIAEPFKNIIDQFKAPPGRFMSEVQPETKRKAEDVPVREDVVSEAEVIVGVVYNLRAVVAELKEARALLDHRLRQSELALAAYDKWLRGDAQ